jgi:MFS family permease
VEATAEPGARPTPGPRAIIGVSLGALASTSFALVAVGVLAPDLAPALGLSRAGIGWVAAMSSLGGVLASGFAGAMTDRIGPAPVLGTCLAGFACAMGFASLAPNAWTLGLAMLFGGGFAGSVNPPTNVMIAGRLARRLGLFLSFKQSGVPVGALVAGVTLPAISAAAGWRAGLAVSSGLLVIAAASTGFVRNAAVVRMRLDDRFEPMRRTELGALAFYGFVLAGVQWALFTYTTLYLTEDLGFSHVRAGVGLAVAQALGIAGRLTWGHLSDRTGRRLGLLLVIAITSAACLVLFAAGPGRIVVWPLLAASGFAIVGWNGAFHALVAERAGPGRIGRLSGRIGIFILGGTLVFPPVTGQLVDSTGSWRPLFVFCAVAVCLAGATLWTALRNSTYRPLDQEVPE